MTTSSVSLICLASAPSSSDDLTEHTARLQTLAFRTTVALLLFAIGWYLQ